MDVRFNVKTHFNAAESARLRAYLRKGKYASDRKSNGKISKRTTMVLPRNRIWTKKNWCFDIKKNRRKDCNNEKTYEGTLRKEKSTALRIEE